MNKLKIIILIFCSVCPSMIRVRLMNVMGFKIDHKAKLKLFSVIIAKNIIIDAFAKIDSFVFIAGLEKLHIGAYCAIQRFTVISGKYSLILKKRAMVGSRCIISAGAGDVEIGEYSAFAPRSSIYSHGTFLPVTQGYPSTNKGVIIGDFCWIMQHTSIGPGVQIESNSVILPGSSIVKNIPGNIVVYDTPVERKKFPVYFFKKKVEETELVDLIKEIIVNYLDTIKSGKYSLEYKINEDSIKISYRNKDFIIYFSQVNKDLSYFDNKFSKIFFYYDLDIELMKTRHYVCYDFKKIISSYSVLPEILLKFDDYAFFNYGLKFIDIDYL